MPQTVRHSKDADVRILDSTTVGASGTEAYKEALGPLDAGTRRLKDGTEFPITMRETCVSELDIFAVMQERL
ncbi:MAG: hypothetical protein AAF735_05535 [Myxococcota bacterium]